MNFSSALHYLKSGYRLRRPHWAPDFFIEKTIINIDGSMHECILTSFLTIIILADMMADDWEILFNE